MEMKMPRIGGEANGTVCRRWCWRRILEYLAEQAKRSA
jgi:hypothetical protein